MIDYSLIFIYSDIPPECPKCMSTTEIIMDLLHTNTQTQIHLCHHCGFEFIMQSDDEFEEYDRKVFENDDADVEIEIFI